MRLFPLFILMSLLLPACEERVDIALTTRETELLVVEGVITNERRNHRVRLSLPHLAQNGEGQAVSGASVYVLEDTTIMALTEFPEGSGNYYTPPMRGLFGKLYTLVIQYEGKVYFAQDSPVPVEPMSELKFREAESGLTLTFNPEGRDANYIEHFISWRHTPSCAEGNSCDGRVIYYDLKTIDVNEIYKPEQEVFYFPAGSVVIRKKYSVSAGYRSFLRSMLSETQWRGGVFDVQRSNVPTNLSDGAVGFFAVCSVVSDTTMVR